MRTNKKYQKIQQLLCNSISLIYIYKAAMNRVMAAVAASIAYPV